MMHTTAPTRVPNVGEDSGTLPVVLLTGFLGAGKTTLVNHILTAAHGRRLAVIVNEFGELGIDGSLVTGASGSVIELANGCICCAMQGQLPRALQDVLTSSAEIDGILIETSGLADPVPVVTELDNVRFARETRLEGVVTVIDAANFDRNLDSAEAAYQQITCADVLLVNKTDLVAADIPGRIEEGIRLINPAARTVACTSCDVPLDVLFGPSHRAHHHADDHSAFASVVLRFDSPLDGDRLGAWLERLPTSVFRAKGFVRLSTVATPVAVNAVGPRYTLDVAPSATEVGGAALVLIGRDMPVAELEAGLCACLA